MDGRQRQRKRVKEKLQYAMCVHMDLVSDGSIAGPCPSQLCLRTNPLLIPTHTAWLRLPVSVTIPSQLAASPTQKFYEIAREKRKKMNDSIKTLFYAEAHSMLNQPIWLHVQSESKGWSLRNYYFIKCNSFIRDIFLL